MTKGNLHLDQIEPSGSGARSVSHASLGSAPTDYSFANVNLGISTRPTGSRLTGDSVCLIMLAIVPGSRANRNLFRARSPVRGRASGSPKPRFLDSRCITDREISLRVIPFRRDERPAKRRATKVSIEPTLLRMEYYLSLIHI